MKLENEAQKEPDIFLQAVNLAKEYQRHARERELAEEQEKYSSRQKEQILNFVGEGVYGLDLAGNTTFANPAAEKMLGYTEEELLGKPQHAFIHHSKPDGSPYPQEECLIYASFTNGRAHREAGEVFWRKDGSSFPVEYVSAPIRENGQLIGAVVTFRDITERKRVEAKILLQYELTRIFLEDKSLGKTFPRILKAMGEFMEWEISYFWEKKPDSEELHCRHAWNASCLNKNAALKEFKKTSYQNGFKKGMGLPGRVWEALEPFWIPDVCSDNNFPRAPFARKLGMQAGFGFPVFSKNQFKGVIEIFTRQPCRPDIHQMKFMTNLGGQIGQWMHLKKAEKQLGKLNLKNLD